MNIHLLRTFIVSVSILNAGFLFSVGYSIRSFSYVDEDNQVASYAIQIMGSIPLIYGGAIALM
jgi:hypothetical protein